MFPQAEDLEVQGFQCFAVSPTKAVVSFGAHSVPSGIPNNVFSNALKEFGEVKHVFGETSRSSELVGVQPTTRLARGVL